MSLSHFFQYNTNMANCNKLVGHAWEILSFTWYHRWLQPVSTMGQDAQKPARKFCAQKTAEKNKTHPEKPEKGETGCVLGAGGDEDGWERVKPDEKTRKARRKSRDGLVSAAASVGPGRSPPGCRPPRHAPQAGLRAHLAAKSYRTLTKKSGTAEAIPDFFGRGRRT